MTILVTGGAGYIGSHVVLALLDSGENVVVIDDMSTGHRSAIPNGASLIVADFGERHITKKIINEHKIKSIVHVAGSSVVEDSFRIPMIYYNNNSAKLLNLLETAADNGVEKFIFSSTAAVYGVPATVPVSEDAEPAPISPYGRSKFMSELIIKDVIAAHSMRAVILRYFNVAGADPDGRCGKSISSANHLVKKACQAALGARRYLDVFGTDYQTHDGTCVRDYVHVSDIADCHVRALKYLSDGGKSNIFNCGYSDGYSVLDVIKTVWRVSGRTFELCRLPRRAGDPPVIIANSEKIRAELMWTPKHQSIETIVRHALAQEQRSAFSDLQ